MLLLQQRFTDKWQILATVQISPVGISIGDETNAIARALVIRFSRLPISEDRSDDLARCGPEECAQDGYVSAACPDANLCRNVAYNKST